MEIPAEVNRGFGSHPLSELKSAVTAETISTYDNSFKFSFITP